MSSRALDTSWYHYLRVNADVLTSRGYRWDYDVTNSVGSGGLDVIGFTTADSAVSLMSIDIRTTGTRGASVDMYVGGAIGLGAPVQGLPANHDTFKPEPLASIEDTEIVVTPGTLIGSLLLDGGIGGRLGEQGPPLILAANQFYYFVLTNLDNQTATLTTGMSFAAIGGELEG